MCIRQPGTDFFQSLLQITYFDCSGIDFPFTTQCGGHASGLPGYATAWHDPDGCLHLLIATNTASCNQ
jgi:hypothetical protein